GEGRQAVLHGGWVAGGTGADDHVRIASIREPGGGQATVESRPWVRVAVPEPRTRRAGRGRGDRDPARNEVSGSRGGPYGAVRQGREHHRPRSGRGEVRRGGGEEDRPLQPGGELLRHRRHLHAPRWPALRGRGVGRGGHVPVAWGRL